MEIVANNIDGNCSDDRNRNRNNFCCAIVDGVVMTVSVRTVNCVVCIGIYCSCDVG